MSAHSGFVKSADTGVPVVRSKAEIERVLRRYGASGFSVAENYAAGKIVVEFAVPNDTSVGAHHVRVKLPVDVLRVYQMLFPTNRWGSKVRWTIGEATNDTNKKNWAQAERVAWRNLLLWIDAALSAAACGLQTISESLLAHAVVDGERVIDLMERAQAELGPGVRALLASPADAQVEP